MRAAKKTEYQRLEELWKAHCPDAIDRDEMWEVIGVERGGIWLSGGVCLTCGDNVYLNLGSKAADGDIDGLFEIVSSEYKAARQQVLSARKAA